MKNSTLLIACLFFSFNLFAQEEKPDNARFVTGLSGPELLHVGLTYRIANASLLGISAGGGPSAGLIWTSISLEHRLYFGKNSAKTNQKILFFRQGTSFFPPAESSRQFTANLSLGKDFPLRNIKNGITVDAGIFYLAESEKSSIILVRSLNLWPALRFQFYFTL